MRNHLEDLSVSNSKLGASTTAGGMDDLEDLRCPKCHSLDDWDTYHHHGDGLAPECDYSLCHRCGFEWDHQ